MSAGAESAAELSSHLTSGAVIVYLIDWLKSTRLAPWISPYTGTLNRVTSCLMAAIAVLGITWAYDAQTGDLIVHGLRWSTLALFAWEWAKQFTLQQVLYDWRPAKPAAVTLVLPTGEATHG